MCSECGQKHPSTIRLHQHFCDDHVNVDADNNAMNVALEELFQKSVGASLFLPEASGVFENWNHSDNDFALIEEASSKTKMETTKTKNEAVLIQEKSQIQDGDAENAPISNLPNESLFQEEDVEVATPAEGEAEATVGILPDGTRDGATVTEVVDKVDANVESETDGGVYEKLGYKQMDLEIFQKLQKTFGSEECEYCGRLFYSRSDHEAHLRTHTGKKCMS